MDPRFLGDTPPSNAEVVRTKLEAFIDAVPPGAKAAAAAEIVLINIAGSTRIEPRDRSRLVGAMLPLVRAEAVAAVTEKILSTLADAPSELHPVIYLAIAEATLDSHKEAKQQCSTALEEAQRIVWPTMSKQQQDDILAAGGTKPKGF